MSAVHIGAHQWQSRSDVNFHIAFAQRLLRLLECPINDLFDRHGLNLQFKFSRFQLGHLRSFLDQAVQPIALFVNDSKQLMSLFWIGMRSGQQIGRGGFDGRQGRPEIMGNGVQKRRF